ncbi:hypothetical protein Tco_1531355 [Tanacetum coccineum]
MTYTPQTRIPSRPSWGCDRLVSEPRIMASFSYHAFLSDSSDERVGITAHSVPVVETTLVASPTGLCGLVPYTGSDSDSPDEMTSPEHISPLPAISPFICTDSSEAPDSSDGPIHHRRTLMLLPLLVERRQV